MALMVVDRDVNVEMRDGVRLATDVYRPAGEAPVPVLLYRTPYDKRDVRIIADYLVDPLEAVERGYAVVTQDSRGCFASEGEFEPFVVEKSDGHDTIRWAASQEWCTGAVGVLGSSYNGVTALQAAVDAPEELRACFAYLTSSNYHDSWVYNGGAFELAFCFRWSLNRALDAYGRTATEPSASSNGDPLEVAELYARDPIKLMRSEMDIAYLMRGADRYVPHWRKWLEHPNYDEYWKGIDVVEAATRGGIHVPVLQIAGWYDGFLKGQLDLHRALVGNRDSAASSQHRLIVGPWSHASYLSSMTQSVAGQRDFGPDARGGGAVLANTIFSWFDTWLRNDRALGDSSSVRYFQIGPNEWRQSESWPPLDQEQHWFLRSGGNANTRNGDGLLLPEPPIIAEPYDSFRYDPEEPAPTVGGRHLYYEVCGAFEQSALEERVDVLVYTSPMLVGPVEVAGPIRVQLWVRSSAPTTDFTATLVDVGPDDAAFNVAEGIRRATRDSKSDGTIAFEVSIDLWDTAYTFEIGHRIRVHVTSSSFPRFDRNPNVLPPFGSVSSRVAIQHVLHEPERPSFVSLAVAEMTG